MISYDIDSRQDIHEPMTSFFKSLRDCKKKLKQSVWIWSGDTLSNKDMKITIKKQAGCQRDDQQWIESGLSWDPNEDSTILDQSVW